ncbi:MAG: hypothetical protein WEB53_08265 [Akkermansiaceae bacterium]
MQLFCMVGVFGSVIISPAWSQLVVPAHPKKFTTRPIGSGNSGGVAVDVVPRESAKAVARYVTHIVLYDDRMWTSTEGKPLLGKLIAFEDLVAEAPKGAAAPAMPSAPDKPTVTRGDKIRLLVNQKPVEVGMERLCTHDREFIAQIEAAVAKKAAAPEP